MQMASQRGGARIGGIGVGIEFVGIRHLLTNFGNSGGRRQNIGRERRCRPFLTRSAAAPRKFERDREFLRIERQADIEFLF